jgi:uncharacterized membrane protein YagU involved in acid resistance
MYRRQFKINCIRKILGVFVGFVRWGFEVNVQPQSGWLEFLRPSGERQKHISALNGALATGCEAPGLYGKKPLLVSCPRNNFK